MSKSKQNLQPPATLTELVALSTKIRRETEGLGKQEVVEYIAETFGWLGKTFVGTLTRIEKDLFGMSHLIEQIDRNIGRGKPVYLIANATKQARIEIFSRASDGESFSEEDILDVIKFHKDRAEMVAEESKAEKARQIHQGIITSKENCVIEAEIPPDLGEYLSKMRSDGSTIGQILMEIFVESGRDLTEEVDSPNIQPS
jgi:hypothetical protein